MPYPNQAPKDMTQIESDDCFSEDTYEEQEEQYSAPRSNNITRFSKHRLPTSPSERFWSQIISPTLERRMNKHVYKDGKRCLIENTNNGALHYVHCLSRQLDPRRINDLEFAWMSTKFKALWEDYKLILVPEDCILECYHMAGENDEIFPDIDSESLKPNHFLFSTFPFQNLGILTSHIHPKYAICHIVARSMMSTNMLMFQYGRTDPTALALIHQCIWIIASWSPYGEDVASNDNWFLESQVNPDNVYSETSDRTTNCRLRPHWSDECLIEERGYVYVKEENGVVRLKHKEDAPHLLTAKKLRRFEEKMFVHQTAKTRWEAIELWRSTVSGKPEEQELIGHSLECDDIRAVDNDYELLTFIRTSLA
ncbi:hypothetical protein Clacol_006051 [Clathrus columnatus]|uniref:Uncharacterized protein n=1 Tax=Clathrus columnatus TaxID=1419009 RepID=A0AAV5AF99_9AGAM|nr:hypothetical protein Clacol_006051 [Clathrus columnatus]